MAEGKQSEMKPESKVAERMTPQQAKTFTQTQNLERDNYGTKYAWICLNSNGRVCISKQQTGQPQEAYVSLRRRDFDALIRWYLKPQKVSSRWRK